MRLFSIGMQNGDPLLVLRNKLTQVTFPSQTKTLCNSRKKCQCHHPCISKNSDFFYRMHILLSLVRCIYPCSLPTRCRKLVWVIKEGKFLLRRIPVERVKKRLQWSQVDKSQFVMNCSTERTSFWECSTQLSNNFRFKVCFVRYTKGSLFHEFNVSLLKTSTHFILSICWAVHARRL